MRQVLLLLFLVSSPFIVSRDGSSPSGSEAKAFVNGEWFDGKDFQSATFYTVNGLLTKRKPNGPLETVDLHGGFVVPAFADAHNHFPSSKQDLAAANRAYLDAGVFYVLNAGGNAEPANSIREQLGTPATIDVIFAHALFTCSGGHPGIPRRISNTSWTGEFSHSINQNLKDIFSTPLIRSPNLRRYGPNTSPQNRTL
jgi:hypothetical protein